MEIVLNTPMIAQSPSILLGTHQTAAYEIMHFLTFLALDLALADTHTNRFQSDPRLVMANAHRIAQDEIRPLLGAPVTLFAGLISIPTQAREVTIQRFAQTVLDVFEQVRLVVFDCQDIVTASLDDLFGNVLLAAHGVDGDQSPLQIQQFQQPGNRRDFVGLLLDGHLAQAEVGCAGPGTDQVQRSPTLGSIARVPQGFAVDSNVSQTKTVGQGLNPLAEAGLEGLGIKPFKDTFKGIVRGDAIGQSQEGLQPS